MINAYGQEHRHRLGLEVLEITEELDRSDRIIYKGSVINLGNRTIRFPQIIMTLKLDGKVVAIKRDYLVGSSEDYNLIPGGVGSFEIRTYLKRDEFDAYAVTFEGRLGTLWSEFVTGNLRVLEQTLNWGNDSLDKFPEWGGIKAIP